MLDLKIIYLGNYDYDKWGPLKYETEEASGFDLRCSEIKDVILDPGEIIQIRLGVCLDIPRGFEVQIRPRSGMTKHNLPCIIGTVDSDYTGEIKASMVRYSWTSFTVKPGDRICQGVLVPVMRAKFQKVDKIYKKTERGNNGFGSTGK